MEISKTIGDTPGLDATKVAKLIGEFNHVFNFLEYSTVR